MSSRSLRLRAFLIRPGFQALMVILIFAVVYFLSAGLAWELRLLLAFDLSLLVHLGIYGSFLWHATPQQTYRHAQRGQPSHQNLLILIVMLSSTSLVAVALMLDNAQKHNPLMTNLHMGLSLLAIFLSWLLVHTYYAVHYAFLYYNELEGGRKNADDTVEFVRGLEFPNQGLVTYRDFLYYSFTIAMCYQTSDVSILSYEMRSVSLVQSVVAFIFVAVIFGLVVNVISNLV